MEVNLFKNPLSIDNIEYWEYLWVKYNGHSHTEWAPEFSHLRVRFWKKRAINDKDTTFIASIEEKQARMKKVYPVHSRQVFMSEWEEVTWPYIDTIMLDESQIVRRDWQKELKYN